MRVTKTVSITVTGILDVTAAPSPSVGYTDTDIYVDVSWSPQPSLDYDVKVQWGDGTSTTKRVSVGTTTRVGPKRYATAATYTITVTVDELLYGAKGTATATIPIAVPLAATLTAQPVYGNVPLPVTFTMGISNGFTPYTWSLDPGDGSAPYTGTRPAAGNWTQAHTYTKAGTWTATLTATDALGATVLSRAVARTDLAAPGIPTAAAIMIPLVASLALLKVSR